MVQSYVDLIRTVRQKKYVFITQQEKKCFKASLIYLSEYKRKRSIIEVSLKLSLTHD